LELRKFGQKEERKIALAQGEKKNDGHGKKKKQWLGGERDSTKGKEGAPL
jgi:hypothetical protein